MPYLGIFRLEFWKTIVIFETSTRKFVKIEFLIHTVTFGIWFVFSKVPESAFFDGPGPDPSPLNKVYQPGGGRVVRTLCFRSRIF